MDDAQAKTIKGQRMGRLKFAGVFIACQIVGIVTLAVLPDSLEFFRFIISIILLLVLGAISAERLHDMNKSGWWFLLFFIPLLNLILCCVLLFKRGDIGENRYGVPKSGTNKTLDTLITP